MSDGDRPLKILHLASSGRWTGAAEPAANLAVRQQAHGHTVAFACIGGSSFERRVRAAGLTFVESFQFDRRLNPGHIRADVRRLRHWVNEHKPDVVHCHLPHDHWIAALALRRPLSQYNRRPTAVVRTMHRDRAARGDLPHRWLVGKATDQVIVVGQSARRELIERVGLPAGRVTWVRGAVDVERFRPGLSPQPVREHYKITAAARVAGMVARMQPHRGHHALIDVVEPVVAAVPEAFFALAGRGELKRELVSRIRSHPLYPDHLRRFGYHKHDLPEAYAAMDVVVLMVPGSDGSCRAMLEAMGCGRPVIGARIGAMLDAIEPGVNGWLFAPGDAGQLTQCLIEALSNPDATRAMGEAARRFVQTEHHPDVQYRRTLDVYREAHARRGASQTRN